MEKRTLRIAPTSPEASGFAGARSVTSVESERTQMKSGQSSKETRYYLSSLEAGERSAQEMARHIRGHWAAVEIRTHWKRDVLMGEDATRSRNPELLANLALMRNALLALHAEHYPGSNLVELQESVQRLASLSLRLLRS